MSFSVKLCLAVVAAVIGRKCEAQKLIDDWISDLDHIQDPELDKDWRQYVDQLGGEYEESPGKTPKNDETDFKYLKEYLDWNPTSPREVPFLAILYVPDYGASQSYMDSFKGDPDPGWSHVEPGTACGGALLSPKHVLTTCGCLFPLIVERIFPGLGAPFEPNDKSARYKLLNHKNPGKAPAKVYVTFSLLRFVPDGAFEVDEDSTKWPKDTVINCKSFISTLGSTEDPNLRGKRINGELIVVPFKKPTETALFPIWPPPLIVTNRTDPNLKELVVIASIGMRLVEKTKLPFQSSVQVSSLETQHCLPRDELVNHPTCGASIWNSRYTLLDRTHVCFCPVSRNQRPQLVGGTIGWPVVTRTGYLVGLTVTERRPEDGTVVVAMLTKVYTGPIEEYIGKQVLEDQNIPPHVYRQQDLKQEFMIYDYWASQFRTPGTRPTGGPGAKSGATNFGLEFPYFLLILGGFLRP